ncbi:MAG TPA: TMEM175 family protein [Streptosporangiaceae bacterium]
MWVNHHAVFGNLADVNRTLLFLNLLLLFFVVAIPFATSTFADYLRVGGPDASLAAAIYEGVFTGMGLSFALLFFWAVRGGHMKAPLTSGAAKRATARFGIGNLAYFAAIGIAFVSPVSSLVISGLVAVYYVFEQTPGGPAQPSGNQA